VQSQNDAPWCFIRDFNTILEAHEHSGSHTPARPPMVDFQSWTDNNDFLHLPTMGAAFTSENGWSGRRHIIRRLNRVVCNQNWLDRFSSISCLSLIKHRSDHYPIMLEIKTDNQIFASSFKILKMLALSTRIVKVSLLTVGRIES